MSRESSSKRTKKSEWTVIHIEGSTSRNKEHKKERKDDFTRLNVLLTQQQLYRRICRMGALLLQGRKRKICCWSVENFLGWDQTEAVKKLSMWGITRLLSTVHDSSESKNWKKSKRSVINVDQWLDLDFWKFGILLLINKYVQNI